MVDLIQIEVKVLVHDDELIVESPLEVKHVFDGPDGGAFEDIDYLFWNSEFTSMSFSNTTVAMLGQFLFHDMRFTLEAFFTLNIFMI